MWQWGESSSDIFPIIGLGEGVTLNDDTFLVVTDEFFEFIGAIVVIDHIPKLGVVLDNLFKFAYFSVTHLYDFQWLHVEVVFEREVDINFAGTNEKFLQLHVLEFLVEDQVGAQLGDVEL